MNNGYQTILEGYYVNIGTVRETKACTLLRPRFKLCRIIGN